MAGNSVKIRIDGDASDLEKKLKNIGNTAKAGLADVKAGIDLATTAMKNLTSVAEKGIGYNASIEQLKTSFEVMTGSAEKAVETVERLRVMGAETPFEMKDLASTTQLLMQYGFTADEALDRMSMLGDVAQGNVQAMNSIALGYAQMASAGKVNLVDIKQMINGGFNPLQEISERTGESMASLYDRISKGKISVDEITESMRHATSEGGRFYQSMEKQSQTLSGQLSTLKDNTDQLLGSLTEGVSEGLRDQILPFANNLVAELQGAFDAGGYQGLVDTATDMIPDLLGMMTGELQKGIEGLSRWLPQGATQLMQALPGALRMASTVTPQLTQALFEVAGSVLGELAAMLPELAPIIGEGIFNTIVAAGKGTVLALNDVFLGILSSLGVEINKSINSLMDTVDEDRLKQIQAKIDGKVDTSDLDAAEIDLKTKINTLYNNIRQVLTDGAPDTEEVLKPIKEEVDETVNTLYEQIDEAERQQIEALDPNAPNFAEACKNIKDEAASAKQEVETLHSGINGFIESMAGKSAATVEGSIDQLQTLTDELGEVADEYQKKLIEFTPEGNAFRAVRAGAANDTETIGLAVDYAITNYKLNKQSIEDSKNQAIEDINADFAAGKITAKESLKLKEEVNAQFEVDTAANKESYTTAAKEIMNGLVKTLSQEQVAALEKYTEDQTLQQDIVGLLPKLLSGEAGIMEIPDNIALAMVSSFPDQAIKAIGEAVDSNTMTAEIGLIMTALYNELQRSINESAENADMSLLSTTWMSLLGADGEDMSSILGDISAEEIVNTSIEGLRTQLQNADFTQEGKDGKSGYAQGWLEGDPWDMPAVVDEAKSELQTAQDSGSPAQAFVPLGKDAAAGYAQGMTEYDFSAETAAMAKNAQSSTSQSLLMAGARSGRSFASGLATGIRSGKSGVINAAIEIAKAAIAAANRALEINSPSKATMRSGRSFGEGFSIGIEESMKNAVNTAKRMTGQLVTAADMSLPMRVNMPNLSHEIAIANEQSPQNVNLYVNGRQLGRVMAADNQQAQNSYNRSIALGVGK